MTPIKATLSFGATGTSLTFPISEDGVVTITKVKTPNFTNNSTSTLSILDDDGDTIYTAGAVNESTTTVTASLAVPVNHGYTGKITLSGEAGAGGGDVKVILYVDTRS